MSIAKFMQGLFDEFDGEFFFLSGIVDQPIGTPQESNSEYFKRVWVDQDGGGFSGDDFHGTICFRMPNGKYLKCSY